MKLKLFAFITYAIFNFTNTTSYTISESSKKIESSKEIFEEQPTALKCFPFTIILREPGNIISFYHFDSFGAANGFAATSTLLGYVPTLQINNCNSQEPVLHDI